MDLLFQFRQFIKTENIFREKDRLLLAVSGGVDSAVLCDLCHRCGFDFVIAHCNFQLRGKESERDEAFVQHLALQYGVPFFVKKFDTIAIAVHEKKSIETTARDLRYQWFHELISQPALLSIKGIVTAHHGDDNIETVLMNFFRGTGISGLRGMLPKQGKIFRPLLFARRSDIEAYAKHLATSFVTDSSNLENEYTRNQFRNQIMPLIKESFPGADKNLLNNIQRFKDIAIIYQEHIDLIKKKLLEKKGNEIHLPVMKLLKLVPLGTVVYEIIKEFNFTSHQTDAVINLLKAESGKYVASGSHMILKNRNWLIITPIKTNHADNILVEAPGSKIKFDNGELNIQTATTVNFKIQASNLVAQLDAAHIQFPLLLRKWKSGDYFYPLGMTKKKKISRFFIDQKLSLVDKENTWIIEMDKKIIWVVGMRIDHRFRITPATTHMLVIHYEPK